jgi:hypothetical protein
MKKAQHTQSQSGWAGEEALCNGDEVSPDLMMLAPKTPGIGGIEVLCRNSETARRSRGSCSRGTGRRNNVRWS